MIAYSDEVYDILTGVKPVDEVARLGIPALQPLHRTNTTKGFLYVKKILEQEVLRLLRAYDTGKGGTEETVMAVLNYDQLHGDKRDHEAAYRRTLKDKAWQQCGCPICEKWGIEVIVFRGNNRNRRRGFHNTYVFYQQFQQLVRNLS